MLLAMSKPLLYTLAMIGDLGLAYVFYQTGRTVIPIILVFAALCFAIAAIGSALGKGGQKPDSELFSTGVSPGRLKALKFLAKIARAHLGGEGHAAERDEFRVE